MDLVAGQMTWRFWEEFKRQAGRRGKEVFIDPLDAWRLFEMQEGECAITGAKLDFNSRVYRGTASLDRIDNDGPYMQSNVHWTLAPINLMRGQHTLTYFHKLCYMVVQAARIGPPFQKAG